MRPTLDPSAAPSYSYGRRSRNRKLTDDPKTKPCAAVISDPDSCPSSCPLLNAGCYGETGTITVAWMRMGNDVAANPWREIRGPNKSAIDWETMIAKYRAHPADLPLREREVGDYRSHTELQAITAALAHVQRAWGYTHRKTPTMMRAVLSAMRQRRELGTGIVVRASADSLAEVDTLRRAYGPDLPIAVTLPSDATKVTRTPGGIPVVLCPAQSVDGMTCVGTRACGSGHPLCMRSDVTIGFAAHSGREKLVTLRLKKQAEQVAAAVAGIGAP